MSSVHQEVVNHIMNTPGFDYDIYDLNSYNYDLPKDRIAQSPARSGTRVVFWSGIERPEL